IHALESLLETAAAGGGESVIAAAAYFLRDKPALAGQTEHRGTHQTLIDAHGFEQIDQAAQPHRATSGHDGVTEQSNDQGTGTQRPTLLKTFYQAFQLLTLQIHWATFLSPSPFRGVQISAIPAFPAARHATKPSCPET